MQNFIFKALSVVTAFLISACASKGALEEKIASKEPLGTERSFKLVVQSNSKDHENIVPVVEKSFQTKLPKRNFSKGSGDLFQVTILNFDKGNAAKRAMSLGGEAEIQLQIKAIDSKSNAPLFEWVVKGNSSRNGSVSIGGIDTALFDAMTERAARAAAEIVSKKLKESL